MDIKTILGMGAFAYIGSAWGQVKAFFERFSSIFIVKVKITAPDEEYVHVAEMMLRERFRPSWFNLYGIAGRIAFVWSEKEDKTRTFRSDFYRYAMGDTSYTFWKGVLPITLKTGHGRNFSIQFVRFMMREDELIRDLERYRSSKYNSIKEDGSFYYISTVRGSLGKAPDLNPMLQSSAPLGQSQRPVGAEESTSNTAIDFHSTHSSSITLSREILNRKKDEKIEDVVYMDSENLRMVKDIGYWKDSKEWYEERQIPWKKGVLLYGPPGTGKTALCRAVAKQLEIPLFIFDISTMSNEEFSKNYARISETSRRGAMILIEDFDSVFDGRKNLSKNERALTFDCLLNTIDGAKEAFGILLVITTNNPEMLDSALANVKDGVVTCRPGRIDGAYKMGPLTEEGRRKMANRIIRDCPNTIERAVSESEGMSGAAFQEKCRAIALEIKYKI